MGAKRALLYCWWVYRLVKPLGQSEWGMLREVKIDLTYDPTITLLIMYPNAVKFAYMKVTCIPIFIAAQ